MSRGQALLVLLLSLAGFGCEPAPVIPPDATASSDDAGHADAMTEDVGAMDGGSLDAHVAVDARLDDDARVDEPDAHVEPDAHPAIDAHVSVDAHVVIDAHAPEDAHVLPDAHVPADAHVPPDAGPTAPAREISTVDSRLPILALDAAGRPHVAFAFSRPIGGGSSRFGIAYAHANSSGAWTIDERLPEATSGYPTFGFALDAAERPVVVLISRTAPYHLVAYTLGASGWTAQTISTRRGQREPIVIRDHSGRLNVFAESYDSTMVGAITEVVRFREDGAGGWARVGTLFRHTGDYSYAAFGVSLGPDGLFHGVMGQSTTATTPGPVTHQFHYARPWADDTEWTREVAANNVVGLGEGYHRVVRDGAGVVHLTGTRSGWYHRRTSSWPAAGMGNLAEMDTHPRAGVEIETTASGGVLVYGEATRDRYVLRRLAADGTATTIGYTPSIGRAPLGEAVGHDLVLDGSTAHLVYTATICGDAGCTFSAQRIHYTTFAF